MKELDNSIDWEVLETELFNPYGRKVKGWKALVNNDTGETLQIVSDSYTPVPNEQLVECAQGVAERTGLQLEGYATFKGGRKVLAYLKDNDNAKLAGSSTANYMIIGNSHDKSTAFFTGHTNVINRCTNMFTQVNMQNRIAHKLGAKKRIDALMFATDLYYNKKTGMYEELKSFEDVPMLPSHKDDFVEEVLKIDSCSGEIPTRTRKRVDELMECIEIETNDIGSNMLALFNGATRYSSHKMQPKETVFGNPFGRVSHINRDAYNFCRDRKTERMLITV